MIITPSIAVTRHSILNRNILSAMAAFAILFFVVSQRQKKIPKPIRDAK
jgi:hypothetical protein